MKWFTSKARQAAEAFRERALKAERERDAAEKQVVQLRMERDWARGELQKLTAERDAAENQVVQLRRERDHCEWRSKYKYAIVAGDLAHPETVIHDLGSWVEWVGKAADILLAEDRDFRAPEVADE